MYNKNYASRKTEMTNNFQMDRVIGTDSNKGQKILPVDVVYLYKISTDATRYYLMVTR